MPDSLPTESLHLSADFPPIPTEAWEAAIQMDLNGADYDKALVWQPEDGIEVEPYYRSGSLHSVGELRELTTGSGQPFYDSPNWIPPAGSIRADFLHEAGATTVQELGYALAEGIGLFASRDAAAIAPTVFVFAIGSNYFFEIAKLRAARLLWSTAISAFEPRHNTTTSIHIHACTARSNLSSLDPYTNLLRVTTEAASALVGGCNSLSVGSFGFDSHLSVNVQRILCEEAYLSHVFDPAGGSYYIESITESLAQAAWKLFQQVEQAGGWSASVKSGIIDKSLAASRDLKAAAVSSRQRTLVGVNSFPNPDETISDVQPPPLPNDPFPQTRLAEPFEVIRQRSAAHARRTGRYPKILLLTRGNQKTTIARVKFCLNFFGCGGFHLLQSEEYAYTDADLIVLCSSDSEYIGFAQEVCRSVPIPVLVAGNPKEQIPQLKAAGVQDFVHASSNALKTLTHWQNKLGVDA